MNISTPSNTTFSRTLPMTTTQKNKGVTKRPPKPTVTRVTQLLNNQEQLIKAMSQAQTILSKYHNLSSPTSESWLIHTVRSICENPVTPLKPHGFKFECTRAAAKYNHKLLKQHKYSLYSIYNHHKGSIIQPGSEFRPIPLLSKLFQHHDKWPTLRAMLSEGVQYPFKKNSFSKSDLQGALNETITRGSHQSCSTDTHSKKLIEAYQNETARGWQIPVTMERLSKLDNVMIIPLGVQKQTAVNEKGQYVDKFRITHD